MANEKVTLLDLSFDTSAGLNGLDGLIAKSIELQKTKEQLQKAMKEEKKTLDESTKAYQSGNLTQAEYKKAIDDNTKAQIALKTQLLDNAKATTENNSAIKSSKTLLDSQADSVDALRAQLAKNTKELNAMSAAERNNSETGKALAEETKGISDRLKEMESAVGDNRRNVGNYTQGVTEAIQQTQGFSKANSVLNDILTGGTSVLKTFFTVLKANPFVAIASLIVAIGSAVAGVMKRNDQLMDSMKAAFAPFEVIIGRILDAVANMLGALGGALEWVVDKVTGFLDMLGLIPAETKKAADAARQLERERVALYNLESDNIVLVAGYRRELEAAKIIVGDQLKTEKQRVAAAQQGLATLKKMEDLEIAVLKGKYEQIKAQNALGNSTKEDVREERQALADLLQRQADYTGQRKELENQVSGLKKTNSDAEKARAIAAEKAKSDAEKERIKKSIEATKEAEELKKQMQAATIKAQEEALANLDLQMKQREIKDDSLDTKIKHQEEYNAKSLELERYRLEQGLITQQEYDNKALEARIAAEELEQQRQDERKAMEEERNAMDKANQLEINALDAQNEWDIKQQILDAQYLQEMQAAEKVGADTSKVTEKYEKFKQKLTTERINAELSMAAGAAGQLGDLLGKESKAGKAFAVVQAVINTYLGATKALASGGFFGIAQAAIVIATGMKQVATITKQKEPDTKIDSGVRKYAKGGQIVGASHANGGVTFTGSNGQVFEAEGGENMYIMKKSASAEINALSALNEAHGGNSFGTSSLYKYANGGQINTLTSGGGSTRAAAAQFSQEAIDQLAGVVISAVASMPNPIVTVTDINQGQQGVNEVQVASIS